MLLGDLGADVVKVEKAGVGDDTRNFHPKIGGESVYTFAVNRSKRSLEINFRTAEGQQLLRDLVKEADVLIENFRPGTMEKMGCGWETLKEINDKLIMVSISGFGAQGPYANKAGFDSAIQAMSGLMSVTGAPDQPPMVHGTYTVDHTTSMYSVISILSALLGRQSTGKGQLIELSLLECASTMLLCGLPMQIAEDQTMQRVGNQDRFGAPGNCYKTLDGEYLFLIAGSQPHFQAVCRAMNREELIEDPRFAQHRTRFENRDEIDAIVAEWMASKNAQELKSILEQHGLVCSQVETVEDLASNPQLKYRNKLLELQHPAMGSMTTMGMPYTFSDCPMTPTRVSPTLGQHNEEILRDWLKLDDKAIETLKEQHGITK